MILQFRPRHWFASALIAILAFSPFALRADAPAPTRKAARFEVRFLTGMIDHHHMAMMIAELCMDRAVHDELRMLCEEIMTSQSQEMETMQGWLQDWYGITHEPEMKPGAERRMQRLAALSGEEFEIAFMEMMTRHHTQAIREGMHCLERARHEDLIALCENIVQAQTEETALMQAWLCDWYDICGSSCD